MNEEYAYKIAAEILQPFENRIDVSTGQTLADRIVFVLLKIHKEEQNLTNVIHSDGEGQCECDGIEIIRTHEGEVCAECGKLRRR